MKKRIREELAAFKAQSKADKEAHKTRSFEETVKYANSDVGKKSLSRYSTVEAANVLDAAYVQSVRDYNADVDKNLQKRKLEGLRAYNCAGRRQTFRDIYRIVSQDRQGNSSVSPHDHSVSFGSSKTDKCSSCSRSKNTGCTFM